MLKQVEAGVLSVAYEESRDASGTPILLMHGFPYDIHAFDEVAPPLVAAGYRVIVPYLRGYGPTRFLSRDTPRSGQQAVLAHDLLAFMDALEIRRAVLAGFDWGGRAACIVSALWPERVIGLVSGGGYNIHHIPSASRPEPPERELQLWYYYYFQSERGRAGLQQYRYEFCRLLWRLWSPNWDFSEAVYARTAESFENPDFLDVVIHSYRVRHDLVPGDPSVAGTEEKLARKPPISVPTIVLHGHDNGVLPVESSEAHREFFTSDYERRVIPTAGHNLPQEAPDEFSAAVLSVAKSPTSK